MNRSQAFLLVTGLVVAAVLGVLGIVWYRRMHLKEDDDEATFYAIAKLAPYVTPPTKLFRHRRDVVVSSLLGTQFVDPLPKYFKYKETLLVPVRSQGKCASCWAFAIADMMGDRVSIHTGGRIRENLSVQEMVACFSPRSFACDVGGIPEIAIYYPMAMGLMTEAAYPYEQSQSRDIGPCKATDRPSLWSYLITDSNRHERFPHRVFVKEGTDRSLCRTSHDDPEIIAENIRNMKMEIFLNGPIVGTIQVYDDLYLYDAESVYTVSPHAQLRGGHAIEIFGWSDAGQNTEEAGFQGAYWICRNSWGQHWPRHVGEKYGWFYVKMGVNEAGIEDRSSSALPLYTQEMDRLNTLPGSSRAATAYLSYTEIGRAHV